MSIAVGLSAGFWFVSPYAMFAVFVAFVAIIYTRGYLIPGTPTLTQRYFPDRVLDWFGKQPPTGTRVNTDAELTDTTEIEQLLLDSGAVEPCSDRDDFQLTASFTRQWHETANELHGTDLSKPLGDWMNCDADDLTVSCSDIAVTVEEETVGTTLGHWPSETALTADLAATPVLRRTYDHWGSLSVGKQSQLLQSLRVFVEECPICQTGVTLSETTSRSCCQSSEVVLITCPECDERIAELTA